MNSHFSSISTQWTDKLFKKKQEDRIHETAAKERIFISRKETVIEWVKNWNRGRKTDVWRIISIDKYKCK